jgi:protein-disulfide isomerase
LPLLEQVLEKNPNTVKLVFKNFPLPRHGFATKAAAAALSAGRQGKFWEFHDRLFDNYRNLSDEKFKAISKELGLNQLEFEKGMKDPEILARVRRDSMDGKNAGVRGTPTIFINGRQLKNRTLQGFQTLIDKELVARPK